MGQIDFLNCSENGQHHCSISKTNDASMGIDFFASIVCVSHPHPGPEAKAIKLRHTLTYYSCSWCYSKTITVVCNVNVFDRGQFKDILGWLWSKRYGRLATDHRVSHLIHTSNCAHVPLSSWQNIKSQGAPRPLVIRKLVHSELPVPSPWNRQGCVKKGIPNQI